MRPTRPPRLLNERAMIAARIMKRLIRAMIDGPFDAAKLDDRARTFRLVTAVYQIFSLFPTSLLPFSSPLFIAFRTPAYASSWIHSY